MVDDIKSELQNVPQWRMTFVYRDGNTAAHALSKMATKDCVNQVTNSEFLLLLIVLPILLAWSILLYSLENNFNKKV